MLCHQYDATRQRYRFESVREDRQFVGYQLGHGRDSERQRYPGQG